MAKQSKKAAVTKPAQKTRTSAKSKVKEKLPPSDQEKPKSSKKENTEIVDSKPVEVKKDSKGLMPVDFMLEQFDQVDSGNGIKSPAVESKQITPLIPPVLGQPKPKPLRDAKVTDLVNGVEVILKGKKIVVTEMNKGIFTIETLSVVSNAVNIVNFKPVDLSVYDVVEEDGSKTKRAYVKIEMSEESLECIARAYLKYKKRATENKV